MGQIKLLKIFLATSISGFLSACGSYEVAELNHKSFNQSNFKEALADNYRKFVNFEAEQMMDWRDAGYFADKALRILKDQSPAKREEIKDWRIAKPFQEDLKAAARRLDIAMQVIPPDQFSTSMAKAISSYDCWIEQAEEGWQFDHIAQCRTSFEEALQAIENQTKMTFSNQGTAKISIELFHNHNEASPLQENLALLQSFTERHWNDVKMHIHIEGHADRSGTEPYNHKLSVARAIAVSNAIATPWPEEYTSSIAGAGETKPAFTTADGVRDPRNRRTVIEITFAPKDLPN